MERLLPRHMQIIYLINALHLDALRAKGDDDPRMLSAVSLIDEHNGRRVRMGHLAFLGSHKVNGVSQLHTDLIKETVFRDLHDLYPDRIVNKTNGITFRRWLFEANPRLTKLLVETLGPELLDDASRLAEAGDAIADDLISRRAAPRPSRQQGGAGQAHRRPPADQGRIPNALFDVQIKRIHEYKRQLLNILETIALYNEIRAHPTRDFVPRVKIFAGKAAASYHQAKLIIKLIHDVARVVNNDPTVRDLLKVVFLPNYNVSLAEAIIPGRRSLRADFDRRHGGVGHRQHEVRAQRRADHRHARRRQCRDPRACRRRQHLHLRPDGRRSARRAARRASTRARPSRARRSLREVLESIAAGVFSPDDRNRYQQLVDTLTYHDHFLVTADFDAYCAAQNAVARRWRDRKSWWRSTILNTARTAGSRRIAPSRNMPRRSGTFRSNRPKA